MTKKALMHINQRLLKGNRKNEEVFSLEIKRL